MVKNRSNKYRKNVVLRFLLILIFYNIMCMPSIAAEMTSEHEAVSELEQDVTEEDSILNGLIYSESGYMLYEDGNRIVERGWHEVSENKFYINKKGYVIENIKKHNNTWKSYKYSDQKWKVQRKTWKTIGTIEYYFNAKGYCTRIYNTITNQLSKYRNGEMKLLQREMATLRNGKLYYFNSRGKKITESGWRKIAEKKYIQIGKKGYVICKLEKMNNIWRFHKYNQKQHKWEKQKNIWKSVNDKKYYFNSKGNATRMYDSASKKYYDYQKGKRVLAKNSIRPIGNRMYHFNAKGVMTASAGLYLTVAKELVYVLQNGRVERTISGQVQEYTENNGKIMNCRVLDGDYIRYYNGEGNVIRQIDKNGKMVALTYDDGPSIYTTIILDVLEQNNSVATFFVVGDRVPTYSSILKRAYDMGCEIGNHTYSHATLTSLSVLGIQEQIAKTNAVVQGITGESPVVMRPPGGTNNSTVRSAVGMPLVLWSLDTEDWKTRNSVSVQNAVLNEVKDGDIILMHDLYQTTAQASRIIIPELIRRGYQLVTVSELAECRGGMVNGSVYHKFAGGM